jgi:hypothetical protein
MHWDLFTTIRKFASSRETIYGLIRMLLQKIALNVLRRDFRRRGVPTPAAEIGLAAQFLVENPG